MVGYRFFQTVPFDTVQTFHGVSATVALEGAWWLARHFGLSLQLTAGMDYWVSKTNADAPSFIPDARLAAGVSF